jgi:hypothetical protein
MPLALDVVSEALADETDVVTCPMSEVALEATETTDDEVVDWLLDCEASETTVEDSKSVALELLKDDAGVLTDTTAVEVTDWLLDCDVNETMTKDPSIVLEPAEDEASAQHAGAEGRRLLFAVSEARQLRTAHVVIAWKPRFPGAEPFYECLFYQPTPITTVPETAEWYV